MTAAHDTQALAAFGRECLEIANALKGEYGTIKAHRGIAHFDFSEHVYAGRAGALLRQAAALASRLQEQEGQPALSEREAFMRTLGWQPRATLAAGSQAVQVPGWPETTKSTVAVSHFPGGWDTFIFGTSGKFTTEALAQIEAEIRGEDAADLFAKGPGDYLLNVSYFAGQYGFEGRCEIAPCWELSVVDFRPLAGGEG